VRELNAAVTVIGAVLALESAGLAHGLPPEETPVDRILENLQQQLEAKPDDPVLHYRIGRAHGLALEFKSATLFVWGRNDRDPQLIDRSWTRLEFELKDHRKNTNQKSSEPTVAQLRVHLTEAIKHLNRSLELDPKPARVHVALASVLEAGAPLADQVEVYPRCPVAGLQASTRGTSTRDAFAMLGMTRKASEDLLSMMREWHWNLDRPSPRDVIVTLLHERLKDPEARVQQAAKALLLQDFQDQIAEEYFTAMSLALPVDSKAAEKPIYGSMESTWIAYEAAKGFLGAVQARGPRKDEAVRVKVAEAAVKAFDDLPRPNGMTPIIFTLSEGGDLASCLAPAATVCFDLDGSGREREWPWVRPDTGILVWDPARTGKIASGRQLFGSVSWWIFFDDGYQALAALDNDGDGELRGEELRGIAVWFDRNSDGISDPGEVVPVEEMGIERLAARATTTVGGCPANRTGLRLRDGRILPTYDWIPDPEVQETPPRAR
jgi:hypothetical protein